MMDSNVASEFANVLIAKTLAQEIRWHSLINVSNLDGNRISDVLCLDEFHSISLCDSYFCNLNPGYVFLVDEVNESGKDSRLNTEGFNLYLQISSEKPAISILFDTSELYRLKNAIDSKTSLPMETVEFMVHFLKERGRND